MPSKKKKYNARFPAGRIKKIMQSDEEVGKVAQAVPVIISRTLELFVESLLMKTLKITYCRNAKTLSPSHMKQCIMSESRFDFLRELVKNIPDISMAEESLQDNSPSQQVDNVEREQPYDFRMPSTSCETNTTPLPKNGGNSLMKNGIQMKFSDASTTITSSCSTSTTDQQNQNIQLKRHWESTQGRTTDNKKSNILRTLSDTYERTQTVPTKLMRMDSAPTAAPESNKSSKIRLMHQPKSVPCTSKEASTSYQQPVIPAPIIDIMNICNKPIVKIDYSNLVLPDKESSSGSSPDQNPMNTYISPVINIDLSKIGAQPNCDLQTVSMSASSVKSTLELDEDYDNI